MYLVSLIPWSAWDFRSDHFGLPAKRICSGLQPSSGCTMMVSAVASRCFSYCSRGVEIRNMKLLWPLLSPTGPRNVELIISPQSNHTASQASQRQGCDDHRSTYSPIEHRKSETGLATCQRRGSLCAP
ncbi:uncharacterized protein SEPMUDRAFT_150367 [Sphaerulina musiva SO2202]|uniref:Uncharacterized protein n=1 Tax=Sphaerulina musiva (strain SO2202) TaxID=692275 RepID=M3D2Q7_SPHMS|nr:uncharacterized protein SEPMUDRAFT_150367 [Sphaerulina musiva SO2202]EMF11427.1 hypothetical protein SEPMUDRAFT_150367 [Sphaerulina musiva SO2202]